MGTRGKLPGRWVYGGIFPGTGDFFIIYDWEAEQEQTGCNIKSGRSISNTIGQYTGLPDKNGVKIFEGDIVRTHYANAKKADFVEYIVFHNGRFCATPDDEHCWIDLADGVRHPPQDRSVYMEWYEVIGNIYDNPELLEEAQP